MKTARRWFLGQRRLLTTLFILFGALITSIQMAGAHNNPGFKEVLLVRVEVADLPLSKGVFAIHSQAFDLELPKKTIELVWRVTDGADEGIAFSVAQGDALHAEGLDDGANSRVLRGGDVRIVDVKGASRPFSIEIYANVIDRSKPAES